MRHLRLDSFGNLLFVLAAAIQFLVATPVQAQSDSGANTAVSAREQGDKATRKKKAALKQVQANRSNSDAAPSKRPPATTAAVEPKSAKPTIGKKKDSSKKRAPVPAKKLFGAKKRSAAMPPKAIGYYSRGCLAGAKQLPETGPAWQAMRLSRNRNWAHPVLIDLIIRLATEAKAAGEFPGLLVGDLTQPRGGPMLTGHASHQVGLDADIWLRTPPKKRLTRKQRETFQPISMVAKNWLDVNPKAFTDKQVALIRRVASYPEVTRVGVNPAIKYALCKAVGGDKNNPWLLKVQGWAGHHYHMHVRIGCPPGSRGLGCRDQRPPSNSTCAVSEKWYANTKAWLERPKKKKKKKKKAKKKKRKRKPKPPITMAGLPDQCRDVLNASASKLELLPINPLQALRQTKNN